MKSIKLKFSGFHVEGVSDLTMWGGGRGFIHMDAFNVKHLREIREAINDAGFGVESINGACCRVYANYEGHLVYKREVIVGDVSDFTLDAFYNSFGL